MICLAYVSLSSRTAFTRYDEESGHTSLHRVISAFEAELASDISTDGVGGCAAGVVFRDRLIWARGFGWADVGRLRPFQLSTIGRTGSISKSLTAILMMQLAEAEIIALDDPVSGFLPAITKLKDPLEGSVPVTFRHLASHTAGLVREPDLKGAASGPIDLWEQKILVSIPNTSFNSQPGERYAYSNIGFGILGLALSRAAEKPFMALMEEYIFHPLQMDRSFFIVPSACWKDLAAGYGVQKDGRIDTEKPAMEHRGRGYKVPNGGIYSTVPDLARLISALTQSGPVRILSHGALEAMFAFQTQDGDSTGYGLGFFIRVLQDGTKIVGHSGSVAGYNAYFGFDPASTIGIIILRNYIPGMTHLRRKGESVLIQLIKAVKKSGMDRMGPSIEGAIR